MKESSTKNLKHAENERSASIWTQSGPLFNFFSGNFGNFGILVILVDRYMYILVINWS
jgi:hypothetical protein